MSFLGCFAGEKSIKGVESSLPVVSELFEEGIGLVQPVEFGPATVGASLFNLLDQPCILEHLDVLRDGGKRHVEWLGKRSDAALSGRKPSENRSPRLIGERVKDTVHLSCRILNHMVENSPVRFECQPYG